MTKNYASRTPSKILLTDTLVMQLSLIVTERMVLLELWYISVYNIKNEEKGMTEIKMEATPFKASSSGTKSSSGKRKKSGKKRAKKTTQKKAVKKTPKASAGKSKGQKRGKSGKSLSKLKGFFSFLFRR